MGEHGGFRVSLESEPCREESTGELESWLSGLKKQHQGGLPRAPLFKNSCPSWTAPLTEELTFSVAYLVTKRTVAKRETGSIIFTCGTWASRTRKSRKMTSVPSLGPLNGAKTLKCWGVFTIPLASMNTGNVSPQWSDCRKVLLFIIAFLLQRSVISTTVLSHFHAHWLCMGSPTSSLGAGVSKKVPLPLDSL